LEHENNRLGEVQQLFEKRRSAPVDFSGLVATQNVNQWSVSGVNVVITSHTRLPNNAILVGAGVHVKGHAQNGSVEAESIELISLNEVNNVPVDSPGNDQTAPNPDNQKPAPDNGTSESVPPVPVVPVVVANPVEQQSNSFKGIIQSRVGNVWVINGVNVDVSNAEVSGTLTDGVVAKAEGYFNQNGIFIATQIELSGNNSDGNSNNNGGNNKGSNHNNNDGNNNNNDSNNNNYNGNKNYGGHNDNNDYRNHGEREGRHDHPVETPEPQEPEH